MSKDMLGIAVRKLVTLQANVLGVVCDLLEKLSDPEWVEAAKKFLRKENPWPADSSIINLDAQPLIPEGWSIHPEDQIASRATGTLEWNPAKVSSYLAPGQQGDKWMKGHDLKQALEGQLVLPANVLDWLLEHPDRIPEEWRGRYVFFWGTVYRYPDGLLCVRYLDWDGDWWDWDYCWLDYGWHSGSPAAVLAS